MFRKADITDVQKGRRHGCSERQTKGYSERRTSQMLRNADIEEFQKGRNIRCEERLALKMLRKANTLTQEPSHRLPFK